MKKPRRSYAGFLGTRVTNFYY